MAKTLIPPSFNEQQRLAVNQRARQGDFVVVETGQKYAAVLVNLHPSVIPADYPVLKQAFEAIDGIQSVSLLVDGQTLSSIPVGDEQRLVVECQLRLHKIPQVEVEEE